MCRNSDDILSSILALSFSVLLNNNVKIEILVKFLLAVPPPTHKKEFDKGEITRQNCNNNLTYLF